MSISSDVGTVPKPEIGSVNVSARVDVDYQLPVDVDQLPSVSVSVIVNKIAQPVRRGLG
jgi:hypothetical protein